MSDIIRDPNNSSEMCTAKVCLPEQQPPAGKACWVAGWGIEDYTDEEDPEFPDALKSVGVNILSEYYAKNYTRKDLWKSVVFQNEFIEKVFEMCLNLKKSSLKP